MLLGPFSKYCENISLDTLNCRWYQSKVRPVYGYNPEAWTTEATEQQARLSESFQVSSYLEAYRRHGYKYANLNPVATHTPIRGKHRHYNTDNPGPVNSGFSC